LTDAPQDEISLLDDIQHFDPQLAMTDDGAG
jgi:hypothetical protein